MTLTKHNKADLVRGPCRGVSGSGKYLLGSDSNKDWKRFVAKEQGGVYGWEIAEEPSKRGVLALDSSLRRSARCGHQRRQRGGAGENHVEEAGEEDVLKVTAHRPGRTPSEGRPGDQIHGWE